MKIALTVGITASLIALGATPGFSTDWRTMMRFGERYDSYSGHGREGIYERYRSGYPFGTAGRQCDRDYDQGRRSYDRGWGYGSYGYGSYRRGGDRYGTRGPSGGSFGRYGYGSRRDR